MAMQWATRYQNAPYQNAPQATIYIDAPEGAKKQIEKLTLEMSRLRATNAYTNAVGCCISSHTSSSTPKHGKATEAHGSQTTHRSAFFRHMGHVRVFKWLYISHLRMQAEWKTWAHGSVITSSFSL